MQDLVSDIHRCRVIFPQTVYCWGSQCCLKCVRLGWGAVSASQSLSPVSQFVSHLALSFTLGGVLCPPRWACLPICLPSGFVSHPVLSPHLFPVWLCLSPWLGCCVRLAGLVRSCLPICLPSGFVSQFLAGVLCPPRWACLRSCLPICLPSGFVSQFCLPICSASALSFTLAGVLCPPRWACLRSCLPMCCLNLSPIGLCPHLALSFTLTGVLCPPRWACQFVFEGVSHLALSFTLAGVLCPPRWACLPICLPPGFVFHLGWGAVSASLGLSPNLSLFHLGWGAVSASLGLSAVLSPNLSPIWLCLPVFSPHLFPIWLCLSPWVGCCVRLAGLVSQFVSHLALSPTQFCLRICSPSGFAFHLGWGAVSASLGLSGLVSQFVSHLALSPSFWLGCCVRLAGLVFGLVSQFVCHLALSPSFVSPFVPHRLCLSPWLGCCVRLAGLVSGLVSQCVV